VSSRSLGDSPASRSGTGVRCKDGELNTTCETLFGCVISPSGLRNNLGERVAEASRIAKVELRELEDRKGKKGKKRKGGDDQDTEESMGVSDRLGGKKGKEQGGKRGKKQKFEGKKRKKF